MDDSSLKHQAVLSNLEELFYGNVPADIAVNRIRELLPRIPVKDKIELGPALKSMLATGDVPSRKGNKAIVDLIVKLVEIATNPTYVFMDKSIPLLKMIAEVKSAGSSSEGDLISSFKHLPQGFVTNSAQSGEETSGTSLDALSVAADITSTIINNS